MNKNVGFQVVTETDLSDFETAIKRLLEEGWELHGNLISFPEITEEGRVVTIRYIQALKKDMTERQRGGFRIGQSID